ncbi:MULTISPECIES: sugar ABC transporter ATP-binding protein [unclassified Streptomyces]|uniref:sugar ABC transporter ATP-binding protein n=1 Tax=unclassified Streptomyces TaxID=2593676 RepID=UPI000DAB9B75|nr:MULTISPECIES: sugar ABC transporter ATP-binding protein [unclassified Streptomyces]PZT71898.1 sugar ABC transporter ATP-binding protein [Streptomyces sp. AC1-42T]PZT81775.1 sugar ABC transporter ATP-binding protein [Streptomyces sp. AC1-42W]
MTTAPRDASPGGPDRTADRGTGGPAVQIRGLSRNFGPVRALHDVSFDVPAGDITALLGENGAGKSTLLKILAGLQPPSEGSVTVFGEEVTSFEPATMLSRHGVAIVPQELSLLADRTVAENVLSGVEPGNRWFPSRRRMVERTTELLAELDLRLDPNASVRTLDLATQQLIVVARSIARGCRVLILDEPTAMLTPAEADRLFALMDKLKAAGTTMLYVSHRMPEVFRLADHIQVLRDGGHVASWRSEDTTPDRAVAAMVGRELGRFTRRAGTVPTAEPALKVRGLSGRRHRDISFDLRPGEILGVAGLPDSGRVELLHNLFGGDSGTGGTVELLGEPYERRNPIASVERRLAFVPGERRAQGLLTTMSVGENVGALTTKAFSRLGLIRRRAFDAAATEQARRLGVRTATMTQPITSLSGGNQQKAVLGRWLAIRPGVLILDEPTRGVDIGAKAEIYAQLTELADKGLAILCSSSDLPELLTLTDRIAVMSEGRLVAVVDSVDATEESVMTLATGAAPAAA